MYSHTVTLVYGIHTNVRGKSMLVGTLTLSIQKQLGIKHYYSCKVEHYYGFDVGRA